jgi:hypothetical protein
MSDTFITVNVPATFFFDHEGRGCVEHSGEMIWVPADRAYARPYLVKTTSKGLVLNLHPLDVADLMSDAVHYASGHAYTEREYLGLVASARATVMALLRQGVALGERDQRDGERIVARVERAQRQSAMTRSLRTKNARARA